MFRRLSPDQMANHRSAANEHKLFMSNQNRGHFNDALSFARQRTLRGATVRRAWKTQNQFQMFKFSEPR